MKTYFVSYQRRVFIRDLDVTMYAAQGMKSFFENVVVDIHPIDWYVNETKSNPRHRITMLFWTEINEQQSKALNDIRD